MKTLYWVREIDPSQATSSCRGALTHSKADAWFLTEEEAQRDLAERQTPHVIEEHSIPNEIYARLAANPLSD